MDIDKFSEVQRTHMYFCLGESNQTSEYRCQSILLGLRAQVVRFEKFE